MCERHDRSGQPRSLAAVNLPPPQAPSSSTAQHDGMETTRPSREVPDPVLCDHCGRTASNGISCMGMCVADSGY